MYYEEIDVWKNREGWLKARAHYVNSTEVANLLGVGWETELEFWHRKHPNGKLYGRNSFVATERTRMGKVLERAIAEASRQLLDWDVHRDHFYRFNPELGIGASYDYAIDKGNVEHKGATLDVSGWGCEIKNIDYLIWRDQWALVDDEDGTKIFEPPARYDFQGYQQRMLDGRPGTVFLVCVGGNRLETIARPMMKPIGDTILSTVKEFWQSTAPPEPDYRRDAALIAKLFGEATDHSILDARVAPELQRLRELALLIYHRAGLAKIAEEEKAAFKAELLELAQQHSSVWLPYGAKVDLGRTQGQAPTVITKEMIGQEIGGRAGFRRCKVYPGRPDLLKAAANPEDKPKAVAAAKKKAAAKTKGAAKKGGK